MLSSIIAIEQEAYPPKFWQMDDCQNMEDIAEYCEVSIKNLIVLGDGASWYALVAKHKFHKAEFVDIAKLPGTKMIPWDRIIKDLKAAKIKKLKAELRDSTSWKVLSRFGKRFGIKILKHKSYFDEDFQERMHLVTLGL